MEISSGWRGSGAPLTLSDAVEEVEEEVAGGGRRWQEDPVSADPSESLVVCDVDEALVEKLKAFRFRKATNNAAIIMKIDKDKQLVVLEEEHEDISLDELRDELPERQPRYPLVSLRHHDDGRVSYPLCFIFSSPCDCKPEQQMMYAGSKNKLVKTLNLTKVFEVRTTEELTEEWLKDKLSLFS
ncbi:unnamed protein product [Merluccius merluccius]